MKSSSDTISTNNQLGERDIYSLFMRMSIPITISLIINGLYTLVDSIFVTRVAGGLAMGGISIVFPIQMFAYSIAVMIGSGAAATITRLIGQGNALEASRCSGISILVCLIISLIFVTLGVLFLDPLLLVLGATADIFPYARQYALVIVISLPIMMIANLFAELLRAEGKVKYMSIVLISASLLNIVLDAILIIIYDMGVFGAALATAIAQAVSLLIAMYFYLSNKTETKPFSHLGNFSLKTATGIVLLGIPVFIINSGVSASIGVTNISISLYGAENASQMITAYGLVTRLTLFMVLPLLGMMLAFQTITSFNYGARFFKRVISVIWIANYSTSIYVFMCTAFVILFPEQVFSMFTKDQAIIEISSSIASIVFIGFVTFGISFISSAYFQAVGKFWTALLLSCARVFLVLIPLLFALPYYYGISAVWLSFPIADFAIFALASIYIFIETRKLNSMNSSPRLINADAI